MDSSFVTTNRAFWSAFAPKESDALLLVEEPSIPMIIQNNGIACIILNQAKGYVPVWLTNTDQDLPLFQSYVPFTRTICRPHFSLMKRLWMAAQAAGHFLRIRFTRNILGFAHDGVHYGDIAYDAYLADQRAGTIRHIDFPLLKIFYACIRRHEETRALLHAGNFRAVLVSHGVDLRSGVMLRTAIRYGREGYLRAGHHQMTLQRFLKQDDVYHYAYTPSPEDIETLLKKFGKEIDAEFEKELNFQIAGKGSTDGMYAFNPNLKFYDQRDKFCADYGLDPSKKNIFVMLHALNDYPHSHFKWMLFRDYYDWFEKTLEFAKLHPEVNWIFKQHPSIKFYPAKDVHFEELFVGAPKNVIYISPEKQINTRSLVSCADCVLTCLGSAGIELPAMGGIPAVVAADNFYFGLGFAREPRTQAQYFEMLAQLASITLLTTEQKHRARAAYLYIYRFARAPFSGVPILSFSDEKDPKMAEWYWKKVAALSGEKAERILREMRAYIDFVAQPAFANLPDLTFSLTSGIVTDVQ